MAEGKGRPSLSDERYEELCRRCGRCCHEKVRFGDQVVITDIPCPFLDVASQECTVYAERFTRQPRCSTAAVSALSHTLPADCPYVAGDPDYPAPHLLSEHPEYLRAIKALFPGVNAKQPRTGRNRRRGGQK